MKLLNTKKTFGLVARFLHWSIALLVIGLFVLGLWMRSLDYYHPWYQAAPDLHTSFGLVFMALVLFRVFWSGVNVKPTPLGSARLEHAMAAVVHAFLYALMIALAITGYLYATADGKAPGFFGLYHFPVIVRSKAVADLSGDLHEWFAYVIIGVVVLHLVGAMKHHIIDRDDTLRRMVSGRSSSKGGME